MNLDNPLYLFALHKTAWDLGIIPLLSHDSNISHILEQLDPEEARTHKRKYRKLWRKVVRENKHISDKVGHKYYGVNNPQPTGRQKRLRKTYVYYELLRQAGENLRNLQNKVEHPDTDKL